MNQNFVMTKSFSIILIIALNHSFDYIIVYSIVSGEM